MVALPLAANAAPGTATHFAEMLFAQRKLNCHLSLLPPAFPPSENEIKLSPEAGEFFSISGENHSSQEMLENINPVLRHPDHRQYESSPRPASPHSPRGTVVQWASQLELEQPVGIHQPRHSALQPARSILKSTSMDRTLSEELLAMEPLQSQRPRLVVKLVIPAGYVNRKRPRAKFIED